MKMPDGFEKWNPALRGAYRKGVKASAQGIPLSACPYQDKRKPGGQLTWSRAFIAAWCDGWTDFKAQQDPVDQYYADRAKHPHPGTRP